MSFPPPCSSKRWGQRNQDIRWLVTHAEWAKPPRKCLVIVKKSIKMAWNTGYPYNAILSTHREHAESTECCLVIKLKMEPSADDRYEGQREWCKWHYLTIIKQDEAKFDQASPVTLRVQLSLSSPIDVPIVCSQDSLKSSSLSPIPSPCSHVQVKYDWEARRPPSVNDAALALTDLRILLKSRNTVIRSDVVLRTRLDHLDRFLAIYTAGKGWIEAANYAAIIIRQGTGCSRRLQIWGKNFICDRSALPYHNHANSGCGSLIDNVDFVEELLVHIADIGIHVSAQAIVNFVKKPEVVERYDILKPITLDTACKWMSRLNFKWRQPPKGTYLDGHERPDVVHYHQNIYTGDKGSLTW